MDYIEKRFKIDRADAEDIVKEEYPEIWNNPRERARDKRWKNASIFWDFLSFLIVCSRLYERTFSYKNSVYIDSKTKIEILDVERNEIFWITPYQHVRSEFGNPSRGLEKRDRIFKSVREKALRRANEVCRCTTERFLEKIKTTTKDFEDHIWDDFEYVSCKAKARFVDRKFGEFYMSPSHFLIGQRHAKRGCENFKSKVSHTNESFMERFNEAWGEEAKCFVFPDLNYINNSTKILVIDLRWRHINNGEFYATPSNLLNRYGHPLNKVWKQKTLKKDPNKGQVLYYIKIERFDGSAVFKIGLTDSIGMVKNRFKDLSRKMGGVRDISVIHLFEGSISELFKIESFVVFNKSLKSFKIEEDFAGHTECFSIDIRAIIAADWQRITGGLNNIKDKLSAILETKKVRGRPRNNDK